MSDFDSILADLDAKPQAAKAPAFDSGKTYGTPAKLLDNLKATESSGNAYAINKDTKAMGPYQFMPETVAMLHKQGVRFDPFDPEQARAAADYMLAKSAAQNGGDWNKAVAQYGGFVTKDPSAYVGKVMKGVQTGQQAQQQPSDFDSIIADLSASSHKAQAQIPADMRITVTPQHKSLTDMKPADLIPPKGAQWGPKSLSDSFGNVLDTAKSVGETALNQASGLGAQIIGGWRGLTELAQGHGIDAAANAVNQEIQNRTYQPQTQGGQNLTEASALPGQALGYVADKVGNAVNEAAGPGAATAVKTAIEAAPMLLLRKGANKPITLPSLKVEPAAAQALKTVPVDSIIQQAPQTVPMTGQPRVKVGAQPEGVSPVIQQPKITPTAQIKEPVTLPPEEQVARANILKSVGIEDARLSAIEGNPMAAASEYQMGRFNEPAGQMAKAQFAAEKNALQAHTEGMVEKSGGSLGMDQESRLARGNSILAPLESLKQWFDDKTNQLYTEARTRAQGQQVTMSGTNDVLGQKSNFSGNSDTLQLRRGVQDRMQELGMLDDEGKLVSSTVDQAENLRKYLNEQWSPKNSHILGKLKDALDDDVTKAAGEDIFSEARAMRALRARTLDDPKGISNVLDSNGPNGINRKVATENVASHITSMPAAQFDHIVETLKNVPPEIQPQAQAALGEIKGHLMNKVLEAGTKTSAGNTRSLWNNGGVDKVIADNAAKFNSGLFSPGELTDLQNLQHAGQILSVDAAYPGAAAQAANALKSGLMSKAVGRAAQLAGGGIGSVLGPAGAAAGSVAGEVVGGKLSHRMGEGAAVKKFNKGVVKLSDFAK